MADRNSKHSPLRRHRVDRMLTQQDVAERLEQLAWIQQKRRVGVNPDMVSKWERGEKRPSVFYRKLLCQLYDTSPAALGLEPAERSLVGAQSAGCPPISLDLVDALGPGVEVLQASLFTLWKEDMLNRRQLLAALGLTPAAVGLASLDVPLGMQAPALPQFRGDETLATLESLTGRLERAYHLARPERLLMPARALADTAERYLEGAQSRRWRRGLLRLMARTQLLAGRLTFFDLHRSMEASAHLNLAREAAIEASDPLLTSAALGHMAFLPAEHHQLSAASAYLDGARHELSGASQSCLSGWLEAVESELRSRDLDHRAAQAALARSRESLTEAELSAPPAWFDYFDEGRLCGFEGFALRRSGSLDAARNRLEEAIRTSSPDIPKQRSVMMLDLGSVCVQQGDLETGCALATDALVSLRQAGYATGVDRLREFRSALPDEKHPAARLLEEAVAELS